MIDKPDLKKKVIFSNSNYITVEKIRYDFNNELIVKKRKLTTLYIINLILAIVFSLLIINKFQITAILLQLLTIALFLLFFNYLYYIVASFILPANVKALLNKHDL
ncbi:MAG: hypothetical protein RSF69_07325 [Erysipelotrichaceae bacterium]